MACQCPERLMTAVEQYRIATLCDSLLCEVPVLHQAGLLLASVNSH